MTYQPSIGPGAQIVERTLQSILSAGAQDDVSDAIIAALRHLRNVVGVSQGDAGLKRFDCDLLDLYNNSRNDPPQFAHSLPMRPIQSPDRLKAILIDAVENCLLVNARGHYTSTEVLIDMFVTYLVALKGHDASLGDLLLDLNDPLGSSARPDMFWPSQGVH